MNIYPSQYEDIYHANPITLVDVGAGGGIMPLWEPHRKYLRVFGFEPDHRAFEELQRQKDKSTHYFNVGLHILEKKSGIDEIIQYLSDGSTIEVKINPPELPEKIISISQKNLGVMTLGNFLPADLVESEMWDCPIEYLSLFDLLFPKLRSIVYHGDGF